jgi:hypothetical protein
MSKETLWIRELEERGEGERPDGARAIAVAEYRRWGDVGKTHEEAGCPRCGTALYDRLSRIQYEGPSPDEVSLEWHLDSANELERLKKSRVAEWNGRDVFIQAGKLVYSVR